MKLKTERGDSCPQQAWNGQWRWNVGRPLSTTDVAAHRNVRAPLAVVLLNCGVSK